MEGLKHRLGVIAASFLLVMLAEPSADSQVLAQPAFAPSVMATVPGGLLGALWQRPDTALELPDGRRLVLSNDQVGVTGKEGRAVTRTYALPQTRMGAAAVVLPDGQVLIWGGTDTGGHLLPSGTWFDPSSGRFAPATTTGLPPVAGQSLTVLSNGQVFMAGGWTGGASSDNEQASVWNPVTQQVTPVTTSVAPRSLQSATLLADGTVLLTSGVDDHGVPVNGAQRFDPSTQQWSLSQAGAKDAAALSLAATQPLSGSTDNPADTLIGIRFSQPVVPESVSTATVSLVGPSGPVEVKAVSVQNGRLAFLTPKGDLLTGTDYTVVMSGIKGVGGKALPFASFGFQTAALKATASGSPTTAATTTPTGADASQATAQNASTSAMSGQASAPTALYLSTGVDVHGNTSASGTCRTRVVAQIQLCRDRSYIDDGAWYPGQDNVGSPGNPHWRLNSPDMPSTDLAKIGVARQMTGKHKKLASSASSSSSSSSSASASASQLSGQVRQIDGRPVAHVQVSVGTANTYTDAGGNFHLGGVPAGHQTLYVDGTTASGKSHEYGQFTVGVNVLASGETALPYRLYLPRILARDKIELSSPTTQDMVVTHPDMPGLEIHIPAGTVIRDHKGKTVTELAIVPVPVDRAPSPAPVNFAVYFSLQPGGATVQNIHADSPPGITLTYPNYAHVSSGTPARFISYTPEQGWQVYGKGSITPDGRQLKPEAGVHLTALASASWSIGGSNPGDPKPAKPDGPCCGDPVDLATGTLVENQDDAVIHDVMPITLSRVWHGLGSFEVVGSSYENDARMFGGWRSNYDMYVYSATGNWDTTNLGVRLTNGQLLSPFAAIATHSGSDATWKYSGPIPQFQGAILDAPLGSVACDSDAISECYVLTLRDGTAYWMSDFDGLYEMRDRFGNTVRMTRNGGLLQQVTSPSGRYLSFYYDANNNVDKVTDNAGRTWTYTYHSKSFNVGSWAIESATPPTSSTATSLAYFLDKVTYPDNTSRSFTYDEDFSAPAAGSGGSGLISATSCPFMHVPGTLLTMTDRNGREVMENHYCNIDLVQQTLADGTTYRFGYQHDSNGNTLGTYVADPLGNLRLLQFDASSGYPSSDTEGSGTSLAQTTTYQRYPNGLVQAMTDPLGRVTNYSYDANGNVTQITRLAGTANAVSATYTYTADYSQMATYTDELGHKTTYDYISGCLTKTTDALGHATTIKCNDVGQPFQTTDALGHTTTLTYLGTDLRTVTDPLGHTTTFAVDGLGQLTSVTDPLGNLSLRKYDTNGWLISSTDARGQVTKVTYDNEGHAKTITNAKGAVEAYSYSPRYWVNQRTDALGQSESWTYDGLGNVATHTDRKGQVTTYSPRDALGRFTKLTYADGNSITAEVYDAGNRLRQFTDTVGGTIKRDYDGLDRLADEVTPQGTVTYTYYNNGLRRSMTPASQTTVNYTYDNANRPATLTQGSEKVIYAYDNANRRATLTLPNGVVATYGYDNASQLTGITYQSAQGAANLAYTYDAAGRRISQSGSLASDVLPTSTTQDGTFDANNRQKTFNALALGYDANGSMISDGTNTYVWDARNQLSQIKQGSTVVASFNYDAEGRRTGKTINGVKTIYTHDGINTVQETQGSTVNPILTGLGVDERYARNEGGARAYFLTDALGSTVGLTDATGALAQRYAYDPYGNVASSISTTNPYLFTGRELDETGFYYYRARYYSPAMGRFISEDPVGFASGQANFYVYVGGNPLRWTDPSGLQAWQPGMVPPPDIPGGPWAPAGPGQRPGDFLGPKKPFGPRDMCRYVPDGNNGGPPTAEQAYWKTKTPGEDGWTRYDLNGNQISPEEAHPSPSPPGGIPPWTVWSIFVYLLTYSPPVY